MSINEWMSFAEVLPGQIYAYDCQVFAKLHQVDDGDEGQVFFAWSLAGSDVVRVVDPSILVEVVHPLDVWAKRARF